MPTEDPKETRHRLLTTAESLFAEHGLNGVSLRRITARAGVNLAAVNYHYYDKETLYREIVTQRLRTINSVRMADLSLAEAESLGTPVPMKVVLSIMARSSFFTDSSISGYNAFSRQLVGRIYVEPLPFIEEILAKELQPVLTRFGQALRCHAPSLSPQDFLWRYSLVVGAMHHAMATMHCMKARTNGVCRDDDPEKALENFIAFGNQAFAR